MEKRLAICLLALLTAGIVFCAAWIAWMLAQYHSAPHSFTNASLIWGGMRHAFT